MTTFLTAALFGVGVLLLAAVILTTVFRYAGHIAGDPDGRGLGGRRPGWSTPGSRLSSSAGSGGSPEDSGRHHVPEEFLRVATYRLNADRVARAKVPPPGVCRYSAGDDGPGR